MRYRRMLFPVVIIALLSWTLPAGAAHDQASLAAQIENANRNEGGAITLSADIVLSQPLPDISSQLTIDGAGHSISGGGQLRIFLVDGGALSLLNMTLGDGKAPDEQDGGAIWLQGPATLAAQQVTFSQNAAFQGGAIATSKDTLSLSISESSFIGNRAEKFGGALYLQTRQSDITRSSFTLNESGWYAGAIAAHEGKLELSNSTLFNNSAGVASALEVFLADVTLTHVTILNTDIDSHAHEIHRSGGRIRLRNSIVASPGYLNNCGEDIYERRGNISLDGSCDLLETRLEPGLGGLTGWPAWLPLLDGSPALDAADPEYCLDIDQRGMPRPHGGGCDAGAIESTTAKPAPAPVLPPPGCALADAIRAANSDAPSGACLAGSGHDTIHLDKNHVLRANLPPVTSPITIEGNGHSINGVLKYRMFDVAGGELNLKNVTLLHGGGVEGSAVRLRANARLNADNVTFRRNIATSGGAIATVSDSAQASIRDSLFDGNRSDDSGGAIRAQRGKVTVSGSLFKANQAGRWGGAVDVEHGSVDIINSAFTRNRAIAGGGLHVNYGSATVSHATMVNNYADQLNGDDIMNYAGRLQLRNSIIHSVGKIADDCAGRPVQGSHNINPDGSCVARASADPLLGRLTGSPAHFPLLDGSPAVDAADARFCPETDQLGRPRPHGGGCDIGAIESASARPAPPRPQPTTCALYDQIIAFNTDRPAGLCPAGSGADTLVMTGDITLSERLPQITSGLSIVGNGHSISGDERFPIFDVKGTWLKITDLTLRDGMNPRHSGGAINLGAGASLVVEGSRFLNNVALTGGAIAMSEGSVRLAISGSSFIDNSADRDGGAILMNAGRLNISGSSFVNNQGSFGGAIGTINGDEAQISNSTFSGNQATGRGGAINAGRPRMTLTHLTFFNNLEKGYLTPHRGHAIYIARNNQGLWLRNSIIGGSRRAMHCVGSLSQSAGNLVDGDSCAPMLNAEPMLSELSGWPAMHRPLPGSPAIGAGDARYCLPGDQDGAARSAVGGCDIGAVEVPPVVSALAACQVRTTHTLNFRAGPGGERIGTVPEGASLPASQRTHGWFQVEYRGRSGWISADYATTEGDCE